MNPLSRAGLQSKENKREKNIILLLNGGATVHVDLQL